MTKILNIHNIIENEDSIHLEIAEEGMESEKKIYVIENRNKDNLFKI